MDSPMISFNELTKYTNAIKRWNIVQYIYQIRFFFFNPNKFWNYYAQLSTTEKVIQFLTYASLMVLSALICTENVSSFRECGDILIVELFSLFPFMSAVIIGLILASPRHINQLATRAFTISCYSKFLFGICEISFLRVYVLSESHFYLSLALLTTIAAEVYVIILSACLHTNNLKIKILHIVAILFALAVIDTVYTKFHNIGSSDNYTDLITSERFHLGQHIKNAYLIPAYVVNAHDYRQAHYLYSVPGDTVSSARDFTDEAFITELDEDLDSLQSITQAARFRTNRNFFQSMTMLKQKIKYIHDSKSYLQNDPIDIGAKSQNEIRYFNQSVIAENDSLCNSDFDMTEKYHKSLWPIYLRYLYRPVLYFGE